MLRLSFEIAGAATLFLVATYALAATPRDRTRFSLVAGLGSACLGIDELLDLHEHAGRAAYERFGWPQPPLVNHHDDLIVIAIGLLGLATIMYFRKEVARDAAFASLLAAGLALFATAIAWDAIANPSRTSAWWTEESLELAAGLVMLLAFRQRLGMLRAVSPRTRVDSALTSLGRPT